MLPYACVCLHISFFFLFASRTYFVMHLYLIDVLFLCRLRGCLPLSVAAQALAAAIWIIKDLLLHKLVDCV